MNKSILILLVALFFLGACSTGKKALQKGDYFSAVSKAVERLKSSPENKNATKVLKDGYKLALEWSQEEMDLALSFQAAFKWERAIDLMEQVNLLSSEIRSTPAARKIIGNPKSYATELNMASERAAEERYNAGLAGLEVGTRESGRMAFEHFFKADEFVEGYKNTRELMDEAKTLATVIVVVEAIPVHSPKYRLSSEFFYNQVCEYLSSRFGPRSFVNFYSPDHFENTGFGAPDFVVNMEFFDFSVGNLTHTEKEEKVEKRVKVETEDTTRVVYKNYVAKIKYFTDKVESRGSLRLQVFEPSTESLLVDDIFPGAFVWMNEYAMFVGDQEALDKKQMDLTKRKALPLPPEQDLFVEFTKPIYNQVTTRLNRYFQRYN